MLKVTNTSSDKEVNGVWTTDYEGVSLLIARSDSANPAYDDAVQKYMAPHRKNMERGKSLSPKLATTLMNKIYAESVLLGWNKKGHEGELVLDDDGKPAVYNFENVVELLKQDVDLKNFVTEFSSERDNYLNDKKVVGKS